MQNTKQQFKDQYFSEEEKQELIDEKIWNNTREQDVDDYHLEITHPMGQIDEQLLNG